MRAAALITRVDPGYELPEGAARIYRKVSGKKVLGFIAASGSGKAKLYEYPLSFIPFSTYDLGPRSPQSLAIRYSPPHRKVKVRPPLGGLPPRGMKLIAHAIRTPAQRFRFEAADQLIKTARVLEEAPHYVEFSMWKHR